MTNDIAAGIKALITRIENGEGTPAAWKPIDFQTIAEKADLAATSTLNGCGQCGLPRGSHGRVTHTDGTWHDYTAPTRAQKQIRKATPKLQPVPNQPKTKGRPFRIPDELYDTAKTLAEDDPQHGNLSSVVRAKLAEYVAERTSGK